MEPCCTLTRDPIKEGRVIYQGDNFFIFSTLGSMGIMGYVLIASNEHYEGSGDIPEELHGELNDLVAKTRARVRETYGKSAAVFEHGPRVGMCGWGGCIDHAHLHVVPGVDLTNPFAISLIERLDENGRFYRVDRTEGFKRTMDIFRHGKTSYVMLETPEGRRLVSEVNFPGPSQWLRKLTGESIGAGNRWNWRAYPDYETAMRTVEDLAGRF
jgi:diadenosine tetraphosphate (Ap4A) HIT family hydrolase